MLECVIQCVNVVMTHHSARRGLKVFRFHEAMMSTGCETLYSDVRV